jgi:hypothetical protein
MDMDTVDKGSYVMLYIILLRMKHGVSQVAVRVGNS